MKLLIDGEAFRLQTHGGVTRIFKEVLPRLSRHHGMEIVLAVHGRLNGEMPTELLPFVQRMPTVDFRFRPWRLSAAANRMINSSRCKHFWKGRSADVFLSTYFTNPASGLKSICLVYDMIHELFPDEFESSEAEAIRRRKLECIRAAHRVICISQNTARDAIRLTGIPEERCRVVALAGALPGKEVGPVLSPGMPFLLFVGNHVSAYKNFDWFLAWYLKHQHGLTRRVGLVVVSPYPPTQKQMALIDSSGRQADVHFMQNPTDSELCDLYRSCTAFVYPSIYEGFGIPVLEALSYGAPVVCSNAASLPEVGGEVVQYFSPTRENELDAALVLALAEGRNDASVLRRKRHAESFSWDKTADGFAKIIEEVQRL